MYLLCQEYQFCLYNTRRLLCLILLTQQIHDRLLCLILLTQQIHDRLLCLILLTQQMHDRLLCLDKRAVMCICVRGIEFDPLSTIFGLYF
jgi:hypothetical protein